ncbi:MAG: hypothetical protein RL662_2290 [Bacteroidota bacterium]|jgi:N-acetylglucosamine kinase-like BadF-type ATPase
MILLADGGSTKVDWTLIDQGKVIAQVFTKGANPFFRTREEISHDIQTELMPVIARYTINSVYFYGAGCAFPEKNDIVRAAIADHIQAQYIEVGSDLLAAAKALCGRKSGIACIIGTGSNSCYYDGETMVNNVSPLGYILGDEGSGAVIGRLFIGACLKNQLTQGLKEEFMAEYKLTPADILDRVYKQPLANRFLAGFSPFLLKHINDATVYTLVYNAFTDFFKKNVMQYDYQNHEVHFAGSIAYYYRDVLKKAGADLGIRIGTIKASPMEGLITYYS